MDGRLAVFALVASAMLLLGCAGNAPQGSQQTAGGTPQTGGTQGASPAQQQTFSDPEIQKIYDAASSVPAKPTSLDNLADAYEAGKMSKADYITNSILAIYEPSSLPSQYSGAPLEGYDVSDELMLAIENWESLSPEQKSKIEPYLPSMPEGEVVELKESSQPISFDASPHSAPQKLQVRLDGPTITYILYKMDAIPGKVSVWGRLPANHTPAEKDAMDAKISIIKQGIVDAYPKFKALLNVEPQNEAHVWMKELPSGTLGEATIWKAPGDTLERCRLAVDFTQTIDAPRTQATAAHELFHCFQYHIPLRDFNNADQKWMREATATWSENYVYPMFNTEHGRLSLFFSTRNRALVQRFGLKEYADYLFFYFMEKKGGDEVIAKVLKDAKTDGVRAAIEKITNYKDWHAEYSVWNYNTDPILRYTDTPDFPEIGVKAPAFVMDAVESDAQKQVGPMLAPGAAEYRMFVVLDDATTKKLLFKFGAPESGAMQRHALIKIGNSWTEEDWTYLTEKRFCRTRPQEKVTAVVLIYSNSNVVEHSDQMPSYEVDTTGECPLEIAGTMRITSSINQGAFKTITGTWTSNDVLEYYEDDYHSEYRLKSTSQTCAYTESTNTVLGPMHTIMHSNGGGSYSKTYEDMSESPKKIRFAKDEPIVDFWADHQDGEKWVTKQVEVTIETEIGSSHQSYTEKDQCFTIVPSTYGAGFWELPLDEFLEGDRLHGTVSKTDGTISTTVEFDYTIPGLSR